MSDLDGNAMAGDLREIFAVDVTAARFTCAGCRHAAAVGSLRVYPHPMGRVARCPSCDDVVLRLIRTPERAYLDCRGTVALEIPLPAASGSAV